MRSFIIYELKKEKNELDEFGEYRIPINPALKSQNQTPTHSFCNRLLSTNVHFLSFFRQNVDTKVENPTHPKKTFFLRIQITKYLSRCLASLFLNEGGP